MVLLIYSNIFVDYTLQTISAIRELCNKADIPMSSTALSWVLSQQGVASVIVGCRTPEQLEENCKLIQLSQVSDLFCPTK